VPPPPPISAWLVVIAHDPPAWLVNVYLYIEAYCEDGTTLKHCEKIDEMNGYYWWLEEYYELIEASKTRLVKHIHITVHYGDGTVHEIDVNLDITSNQLNGKDQPEGCWWIHDEWETSQ
jgi:hypothetical protein